MIRFLVAGLVPLFGKQDLAHTLARSNDEHGRLFRVTNRNAECWAPEFGVRTQFLNRQVRTGCWDWLATTAEHDIYDCAADHGVCPIKMGNDPDPQILGPGLTATNGCQSQQRAILHEGSKPVASLNRCFHTPACSLFTATSTSPIGQRGSRSMPFRLPSRPRGEVICGRTPICRQ